jgi:dCMP deaminase
VTNEKKRPSWPERMLGNAEYWAQFSTCVRRKVGAVIYNPDNWAVLSSGYNDTARGEVNCGDGGCAICQEGPASDKIDCNCIHAEMNAILMAASRGVRLEGMMIVSTYEPCGSCRKHIKQAGLTIAPGP